MIGIFTFFFFLCFICSFLVHPLNCELQILQEVLSFCLNVELDKTERSLWFVLFLLKHNFESNSTQIVLLLCIQLIFSISYV